MVHWLNAHITIKLPKEEHERVKSHSGIRWGSVVRNAIAEYLNKLEAAGIESDRLEQTSEGKKVRMSMHLTVSITEEEYDRIKKYPEIKWVAVARKAVIQHLNELEKSQELLKQSKQTPEMKEKSNS